MIVQHDLGTVGWRLTVLDLIFLTSTIVALTYAVRQYRTGRPTYLVLWVCAFAYGVLLEFTTGMLISRSYLQGSFLFNLNTGAIPGYATDMPLYILVLYPTFIVLGFMLIESMGIHDITARAVAAGVFMVLIDAPYILYGNLPEVRWWTWLDWRIDGRAMFEYWHGWPMADAYWEMTWPPLLMWLVWRWERREQDRIASGVGPSGPARRFLLTPARVAVTVNVGGFVATIPLAIVMALGWPQYPVVLVTLTAQAAVLLFAAKTPRPLGRAGWTLLGIHLVGYGVITFSLLPYADEYAPQLTLVLLSFAALVLLAVYPGSRR